jgi:hypothetical protein
MKTNIRFIKIAVVLFILYAGLITPGDTSMTKESRPFYDVWMNQVSTAEKKLPFYSTVAEKWANQVVKKGGEVYITGDYGFWREGVHRAGGLSMVRLLTKEVVLDEKDVVLAGFEYADPTSRTKVIKPLLQSGAMVILFAEEGADKAFKKDCKRSDQLILVPCDMDLDGLAHCPKLAAPYISLTGMVNIFHLWMVTSEFVGACTRLGVMPNCFVSITHPRGWSINGSGFSSRFYQGGKVDPVKPGALGRNYIEQVRFIGNRMISLKTSNLLKLTSQWIVDAQTTGHNIRESVAGHWAENLPQNKYTPEFFHTPKNLVKGDVYVGLEYNYYPDEQIQKYLDKGVKTVFMTTSSIDTNKFKGVKLNSLGTPLLTMESIPQDKNLLVIDGSWPQYDAALTLPDYPYPFCPTSWVAHGLAHWFLVEYSLDIY